MGARPVEGRKMSTPPEGAGVGGRAPLLVQAKAVASADEVGVEREWRAFAEDRQPGRSCTICCVLAFLRAPPFLSHRHLVCASRRCLLRSCSHSSPSLPTA